MAGAPITWHNVMAANLAEASRPMEIASRNFNSGFEGLSEILRQSETIDRKNWATQKDNNTQSYLDHVGQYKTPEEIAADQRSGVLAALRASYGNQIDRAAVRGAEEARTDTLRQQFLRGAEFKDKADAVAEAPIVRAYKMAVLRNDTGLMAQLEAANPNLKAMPELLQTAKTATRDNATWNEKTQEWQRNATKFTDDLETNKVQREAAKSTMTVNEMNAETAKANAEAAAENTASLKEQRQAAARAAKVVAQQEVLKKAGNMYGDGIYTPAKAEVIMKMLSDNQIGDVTQRQNIISRLNKLANFPLEVKVDGKTVTREVPVSMAAAISAAMGAQKGWFNGSEGHADNMEKELKNMMKQTYIAKDEKGNPVVVSKATTDLEAFKQTLSNQLADPTVTKGKNTPKKTDNPFK